MNLDDFEQQIDSTIVDRGYSYFLNDLVGRLKKMSDSFWCARVEGTYFYNVEIYTDPENSREITGWGCDCPYDYGPVCKHIVAVFYAIAKYETNKQPVDKTKIQEILDRITKEDLQEFLLSCFKTKDDLQHRFLLEFAELIEEEVYSKYRTIIRNYIHTAQGPHGFIDFYSTPTLTGALYELNIKAEILFESGKNDESLVICQILVEEIAECFEKMDDSDGSAGDVFANAFDMLGRIACSASSEIKNRLFEWCLQEFTMDKYCGIGFDSYFLEIMPQLANSAGQGEYFLNLLDRQIESEQGNEWSDYSIPRLLEAKIEYLEIGGSEEEILELLNNNAPFHVFREKLVDRAMAESNFPAAKKYCKEGIKIAEEKNHPGIVTRWHKKLFQIAKQENQVTDMRKFAEILFFSTSPQMQWYGEWKSAYPENEWPEKCEEIIRRLQEENQSGYNRNREILAQVFVEEGYMDRLLKLVQKNAGTIIFVEKYSEILAEKYPYEVLDLYEQGIKEYAKQTGRKYYRNVVAMLRKMKKLKGGDEKAFELFKQFHRHYSNRPAMKEELRMAFPQWVNGS